MAISMNSQLPLDFTKEEYARAFDLAKEALKSVGRFKTPPTPEVYELWYRFAEGKDDGLMERMGFLVNERGVVSREHVADLHKSFLSPNESVEAENVSNELLDQMTNLELLICDQQSAGKEFDSTLGGVQDTLDTNEIALGQLKQCVDSVSQCNAKMQASLLAMATKLESAQNETQLLRSRLANTQRDLLIDSFTGIGNRLFFDSAMRRILADANRTKWHSFLMLIDMDAFKEINDTHGHHAGDNVIKAVAKCLHRVAEGADLARYGGDEFALFFQTNLQGKGKQLAEEVLEAISNLEVPVGDVEGTVVKIRVSIGVSLLRADDDGESWFERADKLLYSGKQSGGGGAMFERMASTRS
jgi:diguanylate cyclase